MTENNIHKWEDKKIFNYFIKKYPSENTNSLYNIMKYEIHNKKHRKHLMFLIIKHYLVYNHNPYSTFIHLFSKHLSFSEKLQLLNLCTDYKTFSTFKNIFLYEEKNITNIEILKKTIFDNF